ncbi:unnamed protein product, partial [Effrenium voratum]
VNLGLRVHSCGTVLELEGLETEGQGAELLEGEAWLAEQRRILASLGGDSRRPCGAKKMRALDAQSLLRSPAQPETKQPSWCETVQGKRQRAPLGQRS